MTGYLPAILAVLFFFSHAQAGQGYELGTLLQFWAINDTTSSRSVMNFRLRRAELEFSSAQNSSAPYWFLEIDGAAAFRTGEEEEADPLLQDLGIGYRLSDHLSLQVGQFKIPTTAESLLSSSRLPLPERSLVGRFADFGDRREPGVMGRVALGQANFSAMISNGRGPNRGDLNSEKRLSIRGEWSPGEWLGLGAFTMAEDFSYGDGAAWGANVHGRVGQALPRFEAVWASVDGTSQWGAVGEALLRLRPRWWPVVRVEWLRPEVSDPADARVMTLGINYLLTEELSGPRIFGSISGLWQVEGDSGSYELSRGSQGILATLSFQTAL